MSWGWALAGFGLGAIIGSFLATAAIRWPDDRSVAKGRSRCDGCGRTLGPVDLIPLVGFAIRRGRCAGCGARIDPRHLQVELAAAAIGALALGLAPGLAGVGGALFGWGLLLLGVLDIDHLWLPDRVTYPLALTGIAFGSLGAPPWPNDRLIGMAAGFLSLFAIALGYRMLRGREGLGGGDPKMFAAIGAWLGWAALPFVLLLAALAGLAAVAVARLSGRAIGPTTRVPFGALLAAAGWPVWLLLFAR
jgi:leader peptidase (prepilin peptidase)/N-methyltransferase